MTQQEPIQNNATEKISARERYEILIKARNFHYENFNKWMTYFYVMIASIILGFSTIISKEPDYQNIYFTEILILSTIGFIISLLWHWANKGYYYWNINFISLVNYYEKELLNLNETDRIYFVFANKNVQNNYFSPISGANISTSKISILLSYIFTLSFGSFVLHLVLKECICCKTLLLTISLFLTVVVILILNNTVAKYLLSSYHDHFPDLEIDSKGKSTYENLKKIKLY